MFDGALIVFGFGVAVGYFLSKPSQNPSNTQDTGYTRNLILQELQKTNSKQVRATLERILNGGVEVPPVANQSPKKATHTATLATSAPSKTVVNNPSIPVPTPPKVQDIDISNTSLLLYFGAFLFITSVGLFIAFANFSGTARTVLVALAGLSLYSLGLYLWSNIPKVKQVGETFIGMGMATVPLVGIASYSFIFDQQNAASIWLLTSVVALALYAFTIIKIRTTFVSYMLIGSVISLFEASAGVLDGPAYYFTWMLAVCGLCLRFASLKISALPELKESADLSATILMPMSLIASTALIGSEGTWQLAVTMLLGAGYYGLQAYSSVLNRFTNTAVAQALLVGASIFGAYSINESPEHVALVGIALSIAHIIGYFFFRHPKDTIAENFINIGVVTNILVIIASASNHVYLSILISLLVVMSSLVAYRARRYDALAVACSSWLVLAIVFGQLTLNPSLSAADQSILSLAFAASLALLEIYLFKSKLLTRASTQVFTFTSVGYVVALLIALSVGPIQTLIVAAAIFFVSLESERQLKNNDHVKLGNIWLLAPVVSSILIAYDNDTKQLIYTVPSLLVASIYVSLAYKTEISRWLSTIGWLLLPFAFYDQGIIERSFTGSVFLSLLLGAAFALSISRVIARGKLLPNNNVPLISLAKSTSQSYLVGFLTAISVVLLLSFASDKAALPTVFIVLASTMLIIHGMFVENERAYLAFIPLSLQLVLLKVIDPLAINNENLLSDGSTLLSNISREELFVNASLAAALAVSILSYLTIKTSLSKKAESYKDLMDVSIATIFIAPASVLIFEDTYVAMPIGLTVGAIALLIHKRHANQDNREMLGGLALAGIFWLMYFAGVRNFQAYSHVLAALLALYAYIRYRRNEDSTADSYVLASLATATVPLIWERLYGSGEGFYAIWLLLEQIAIMLLGIYLRKPFITKWGVSVSVGVVLYQLRSFGWALLAVLSIIIIAIAVQRVIKQSNHLPKE